MNKLHKNKKATKKKIIDNKLTSISISKENYTRLKQLGYVGQTFNTVIGKILDDIYKLKVD